MIEPIAAMAAAPLPEMAPNRAQEITVTAPRPPLKRPTKALMKSIRRSEMPLAPIKVPAMMKSGSASKAKPPTCQKEPGSRYEMSRPVRTANRRPPTPNA